MCLNVWKFYTHTCNSSLFCYDNVWGNVSVAWLSHQHLIERRRRTIQCVPFILHSRSTIERNWWNNDDLAKEKKHMDNKVVCAVLRRNRRLQSEKNRILFIETAAVVNNRFIVTAWKPQLFDTWHQKLMHQCYVCGPEYWARTAGFLITFENKMAVGNKIKRAKTTLGYCPPQDAHCLTGTANRRDLYLFGIEQRERRTDVSVSPQCFWRWTMCVMWLDSVEAKQTYYTRVPSIIAFHSFFRNDFKYNFETFRAVCWSIQVRENHAKIFQV